MIDDSVLLITTVAIAWIVIHALAIEFGLRRRPRVRPDGPSVSRGAIPPERGVRRGDMRGLGRGLGHGVGRGVGRRA